MNGRAKPKRAHAPKLVKGALEGLRAQMIADGEIQEVGSVSIGPVPEEQVELPLKVAWADVSGGWLQRWSPTVWPLPSGRADDSSQNGSCFPSYGMRTWGLTRNLKMKWLCC